ncbi:MAG TPA: hypothetical protein VGG05_03230 [Pseudonocardiaceae bacterium]|jgi:hypothetical protein
MRIDQRPAIDLQTTKVNAGQEQPPAERIRRLDIRGRLPSCENGDGGLDVRRDDPQRGPLVHGRGGVFRAIRFSDVPGGVVADESAQDELDRVTVRRGVSADAFHGIDTADTDIGVLATDLIDSAGESFGYLPFTVDMDLSPGPKPADDDDQTCCYLQQSRTDGVLQLALFLLQLDASGCSRNILQVGRWQVRIDQLRYEGQAADQNAQHAADARHDAPDCSSRHKDRSLPDRPTCGNRP